MTDKMFMAIVVMAGVACIAIFFIQRAWSYRRRLKQTRGTGKVPSRRPIASSPVEGSDEALSAYKKRFIYAFQPRFRSEFRIRIRPQYYELLQQIVASDLFNRLSLVDYLDRVLHEHLEENREAIERFCAHPEEREPQQ